MNEIAGRYNLDGRPVAADQIKRMLDHVASWPADRAEVWTKDGVGLGTRQFCTTREDTLESLPMQMGASLLAADARIDNRLQLIHELALDSADHASPITDGYLILKAYERWGEDCPDHLIGDFAFAIWDAGQRRLFCARDAMGVRPFYYCHIPHQRFVFGTTIGMVLQECEGVDTGLNELKIGLMMALDYSDREITIRKNILRLPGGHCLSVGEGGFYIRRYWRLEAVKAICCTSDAEYAMAMREVFLESVRCRLRSIHPVGAQLSGGLDSSSVVCAASRLMAAESPGGRKQLHTFSAIFPQSAMISKHLDERTYQQDVVASYPNLTHHPLVCDGLDPFVADLWQGDQPIAFYNYYLDHAMFAEAGNQGVHVMLTGHDGDAAVSHGDAHLTELAARLRWIELLKQSFMLARKRWKNALKLAWLIGVKPYWDLVSSFWREREYDQYEFEKNNPVINPGFACRIGLGEVIHHSFSRWSRFRELVNSRAEFINSITHGIYAYLLEDLDWLARSCRMEVRHPFFDRRFLEFSLAIPQGQKLQHGVTRYVMHQAMRGIIPDSIFYRVNKSGLSDAFNQNLRRPAGFLQREVMVGQSNAWGYLNTSYCQAVIKRLNDSCDCTNQDYMNIFFAVLLGRWLQAQHMEYPTR